MSWLAYASDLFADMEDEFGWVAGEIPIVELRGLFHVIEDLEDRLAYTSRRGRWPSQGALSGTDRPHRHLSLETRLEVLQRDGYVCARCARGPPDVRLEIDHVVPLARGGGSDPGNLQVLCRDCNLAKGAAMPGEG